MEDPVTDPMDLNWPSFQQWLVGFASIRFDLEQGQMIDECFPHGAISAEEEIDIAFSSFPDSMSTVHNKASLHDTVFFFRVRRRGNPSFRPPPPPKEQSQRTPSSSLGHTQEQGEQRLSWMGRSWTDPSTSGAQASSSSASQRQPDKSPYKSPQLRTKDSIARTTSQVLSPLRLPTAADLPLRQSYSQSTVNSVGQQANGAAESADPVASRSEGATSLGQGSTRYLYGFVFNRQRHDERLPRGGEQKSVVVLTERPYSSVFRQLAQVVGPLFFDYGTSALVQVSHAVAQWPKPVLSASMELPVGHSLIRAQSPHVGPTLLCSHNVAELLFHASVLMLLSLRAPLAFWQLPPSHTLPPTSHTPLDDFTAAMAPAPRNNAISQGIFHEADLFGMCKGILMQLWVLWELLLIGQPLLVLAPTPAQASEAVAALVGLVAPLPCSLDFRPYFTIHDPDFPALSMLKDGDPIPPIVLGVTNLFFLRALKCLPHVLSVGRPLQGAPVGVARNSGMMHPNSQVSSREPRARLAVPVPTVSALQSMAASTIYSVIAAGTRSISKLRREGPLSLMTEHKEALWTNYVPAAKPDISILNRLVDPSTTPLGASTSSSSSSSSSSTGTSSLGSMLLGAGIAGGAGGMFTDLQTFPAGSTARTAAAQQSETMSMINNEILRRHFVEVTTNFLAPFGPFLRASAPPEGTSPFRDPPSLPPFDAAEFLQQLSSRGPGKFLSKRLNPNSWLDLYRRFMEGPNFMPWFQRRRAVAEAQQHRLWCRARETADIRRFIGSMDENQLMEAFHALERHITSEMQSAAVSGGPSLVSKLRGDMRSIFNEMPRDTQQSILFNPEYTALLQGGHVPASRPPGKALLFSPSVEPRPRRDELRRRDEMAQKDATNNAIREAKNREQARPSTADLVRTAGAQGGLFPFAFGSTTERTESTSETSSLEETLSDAELPGRIRAARQSLMDRFSAVGGSEQAMMSDSSGTVSPWETPPWIAEAHRQKAQKKPGIWVVRSGEAVMEGRVPSPMVTAGGASSSGEALLPQEQDRETDTASSAVDTVNSEDQSGMVEGGESRGGGLGTVRSENALSFSEDGTPGGELTSEVSSGRDTVGSPWSSDLWSFSRRSWGLGGGLAPSRMAASAPTTPSGLGREPYLPQLPPRAGSATTQQLDAGAAAFRPRGRLFGLSASNWATDLAADGDDDDVHARGPLNPSPFNPLV